jgi:hypothetical protein
MFARLDTIRRVGWLRCLAWLALAAPSAPLPAQERLEILFGRHLGLPELRLAGPRAVGHVEFAWPPTFRAVEGGELRLRFEHSPALDGERSYMAVSLNHGVLRSLRLEARNAGPTELVVPLPPELLRADNQLVVSVEQFSTAGNVQAEWTVVKPESAIVVPFERTSPDTSLADLPEPILHRRSYEPRRLTILRPTRPSLVTLEATARGLAALTSRVAPEAVQLSFTRALHDSASPVLAVGTLREQPALAALREIAEASARADPTTGIVALVQQTGGTSQPLLALTGKEPGAVRKAALGLFDAPRPEGSQLLLVPAALAPAPAARRDWRGFVPTRSTFRIDEAGDPSPDLAVSADLPARVRMRVPPDARFLPYGHRATLSFETLPPVSGDTQAVLEVYWNDVLLRLTPMERYARGRTFSLSMPIPAEALRAENLLTVAWNGRSGATGPFLALRGDSSVFLPREYRAELPDLALLRSNFYPLSLRADLSDAVLGLTPDEETFVALCELAALVGRLAPSQRFLFRLAPLREAVASGGRSLILLEPADPVGPFPLPDTGRLPRGDALRRLPFVQELDPSGGDGRYVLRLWAPTPGLLRAAAKNLAEPAILQRISGDVAFLAAEGPLSFRLGERRAVAELSHLTRLQAWLRAHWLALPLILAAVSGLLFVGLRLLLAHYRSRNRHAVAGAGGPAT